jgi:hypothetical protein
VSPPGCNDPRVMTLGPVTKSHPRVTSAHGARVWYNSVIREQRPRESAVTIQLKCKHTVEEADRKFHESMCKGSKR